MKAVKLNNKEEYKKYYEDNNLGGDLCCFSHVMAPNHYPCILVWHLDDDGEDASIFSVNIYKEDFNYEHF